MNKLLAFLKYVMIYLVCLVAVSVIAMACLTGSMIPFGDMAGAALWLGVLLVEAVLSAVLTILLDGG